MGARLANIWYFARSSYWFIPTFMAVGSILLASGMIWLDSAVGPQWSVPYLGWLLVEGPEGARLVLSTIAGSMITVAGVVFSITVVAFTLAASQYGPRVLANFMRDTGNQVVFGVFVSTFLYSLVALLNVATTDEGEVVARLSVLVGVLLAIISLGVLIFFIHHATNTLQVTTILSNISNDLDRVINSYFPAERPANETLTIETDDLSEVFSQDPCRVTTDRDGYLQSVDFPALARLASAHDLVMRVERHPGAFLTAGQALAVAWPKERCEEGAASQIPWNFILGDQRTYELDVAHGIDLLVEIALRALSPGVNNSPTAIMCIDRLTAALARIAQLPPSSPWLRDIEGHVRVVYEPLTFHDLLGEAFDRIRESGRTLTSVLVYMLQSLATILEYTVREKDRLALAEQAERVLQASLQGLPQQTDRRAVEESYEAFVRRLNSH